MAREKEKERQQSREQGEGSSALARRRGMPVQRMPRGGGMMGPFFSSPFSMMRSMVEEMDRMMDDVWFGRSSDVLDQQRGGMASGTWLPEIEMREQGNELIVSADLPGLAREDINLEVREGSLLIEGERRQEHEESAGGMYRSERRYGRFERTIPLPEGTEAEQIKAKFKDGVLEVRVPLPTERAGRGHQIQVE